MALLGQGNFSVRKEVQGVKKIYTRSQLQPITPVGDSPMGWSAVPSAFDAPPNYGNLWSSSATVDPNGLVQGVWSTPTLEEPYTSNPLDRFPFTLGSGDQNPYAQYGTDNIREIGLNPFGVSDIIWRGKSHISTNFCGGVVFNTSVKIPLDTSKKHRFSFWFKRNTYSEGFVYFGITGSVQTTVNWTNNSNFYLLQSTMFNNLMPDRWYLAIGYAYPSSHTDYTVDPLSGIYDTINGIKVYNGGYICRLIENGSLGIRMGQYNCPTTFPEIRLWQPRIDLCDGREPSIEQLLKGSPKTPTVTISGETVFKYASGQTVPENTSITLSAELTNVATTCTWQYFRLSDSTWVSINIGQTYPLVHNSSAFQSTNRAQMRCITVVAGITYTSNVLTITKVYDGIAGSNQAPLFLYQRKSTTPAKPTNTAVWTFATASYSTAPNNGWETSIPASNGTPCWVIQAVASGNGTTDTIAPTDWSDPRLLVQDGTNGISPTLLDLTNETTVVSVDYNGNPIGTIDTTTAIVYEGSVIGTGWTFSKVDSGCVSSIVGGVVTVSAMSADKATVTIKANKTGYSELTAVYSLTKLYPAKDGLPTPVYSLLPEHSSISKSKTGVLTPSTTSCKVKLSVNAQTEIIGVDPKLEFFGRNIISEDMMFLWNTVNPRYPTIISKNEDSSYTVIYGNIHSAYGGGDVAIFNLTFKENTQYVLAIDCVQTVANTGNGWYIQIYYTDGTYSRLSCLRDAIRRTQTLISTKGKTVAKITSTYGSSGSVYVYNFKVEESSYFTGFTNAPESYKITRNDSATDVTWTLIDPKGITVDTERVPVVVDGSDGANGNDGLNNTIVTLYQRSLVSSPEVPPARPSTGTIVYNFSNLTVSGDLAGWQIDAPVFEAGTKLFKIAASVASYTTTTSIIPSAWVGPVKTEDTEAADLLRGDFTAEIERLDDRIGLEVNGVYTNGLGKVVQTNRSNIELVPGQISLAVSEVKIGGTNLYKVTDLEQGTIYANGGLDVALNKVRSKTFIPFTATQITVNAYSAHKPTVIFYNSSYASLGRTYEMDGGTYPTYPRTYNTPTGTAFIKVTVNRSDNSNFLPDQARTEIKVKIEEGNKATSYVESDADLKNDLSSAGIDITAKQIILKGNTQIIGSGGTAADLFVSGKIKGSLIEAATIKAEDIDASKIKTENLITTNLNVTSGAKIGGFKVDGSRIINDQTDSNGAIYLTKSSENKVIALDVQGALPASSGVYPLLYIKTHDAGLANYGIVLDVNNGGDGSENYAIAIRSGFISGFAAKAKVVSTSSFLITDETFIIYNGTGNTTISLPVSTNAWQGKVIFVRRANTGGVTVSSVAPMRANSTTSIYSISLGGYATGMFVCAGSAWYYNAFYQ